MLKSITYLPGTENESIALQAFIQEWNSPSPILIVQTSGSTGDPKSISLNKEQMRISAHSSLAYFSIKREETQFFHFR